MINEEKKYGFYLHNTETNNGISWTRYLPFVKSLFSQGATTPPYLIFFVTNRCNALCEHCFNWTFQKTRLKSNELTLSEIEKVAISYGPLMFLFLTGGEPFIRKDLAEIARLFHDYNRVIKIQIPSNGYFTERILKTVDQMLQYCNQTHISVTLSLDNIGRKHDEIRGVNGLFDRLKETYFSLLDISKENSLFDVNVEVTVSKKNQEDLPNIITFLEEKWGVSNILCPLVRGNPKNPEMINWDINKYRLFTEQIKDDIKQGKVSGYEGFTFSRIATAKDTLAREIVVKTVLNPRQYYPCTAGKLAAVILSNGDVLPCELRLEIMGNLRENSYSMKKLLSKPAAKKIVSQIKKEKCFCTHECFLTTNLLFNPIAMGKILLRTLYFSITSKYYRIISSIEKK